jgi:iron complex outermembrane receptor protein
MNKVNMTPIAAAVTLTLLGSAFAAQAQQTAAPKAEPKAEAATQLDQVIITGIRKSRESSMNAKRNSDSLVEVVTSEDIGKMPDKNVADSLQRVVGINTMTASGQEGGFGDNDRISIRGTPASLTLTQINGHTVGTGDWFVLNQGASGRSVSYGMLPSELVDRVVVRKTTQADQVEGGVAGSVDIQTRRPLDAGKSLTLFGSATAVHSTLAGKTDPQFSGYVNWRNDEKTLGLMLQVFDETRNVRRDGQEFIWWETLGTQAAGWADGAPVHPDVYLKFPELKGKRISLLTGSALFEQKRERQGGLLSAQFRPTKDIDLLLSGFSSTLKAANYNRNAMLNMWSPLANGTAPTAVTIEGNTVTSISFDGSCNKPTRAECGSIWVKNAIARPEAKSSSEFLNLDGSFKVNDTLTLNGKIGTTKGKGETPRDIILEVNAPWAAGGYKLNGAGNAADVNITNGTPFASQGNPGNWGSSGQFSTDKENYFNLDATQQLSWGIVESVKVGFRHAKHDRALDARPLRTDPAGYSTASIGPVNATYPGDFGKGLGGKVHADFWQIPLSQMIAWSNKYQTIQGTDLQGSWDLSEKNNAAYVMANFATDRLSGNVGLRWVDVKSTIHQYVKADGGALTNYDGLKFNHEHTKNDERKLLPSLNLKYELNSSTVLRGALGKTMARPDFGSMAGLRLNDTTLNGSGGNPSLKSIRSTNLDVGVDWYFAPRSALSAGLFVLDFDSYIGFGNSTQTFKNVTESGKQGKDVFTPYRMNGPLNTTAKVKGLELGFEMPVGMGFGVNANYTFSDGKETGTSCNAKVAAGNRRACDMIGNSEHSGNVGAYYEGHGLSVRLAYNYRSAYLNGNSAGDLRYTDAVGTLMASASYNLTDNLTLTFDAKDLNDPTLKSFVYDNSNAKQPMAFYKNGSQYYLSLRYKY